MSEEVRADPAPAGATEDVTFETPIEAADPKFDGAVLVRALDAEGILDLVRFGDVESELVANERWLDLAALYAGAAIRAPEPEIGRRMMLSAGLLQLEKLTDPQRAEPFFRRVIASDPESVDALEALRSICVQAGRHEEAADLIDRAAAVLPDEEKPDLLIALATLCHERLRQVDRALAALRTAFECDTRRLDVLERARSIFMAEERWADGKRVLDDEAKAVLGEDPAQAPEAKVKAIAEAYRQLGVRLLAHAAEHKLAAECLERARALGDQEALSKLDELAHIKNEWEARAASFRDEGFEARDKRKAAQLYLRAAELYHEYGKNPILADQYLDRCLLLSPGFPAALRFIETTHREQGRLDDLVKKLNGMVGAVKDPTIKVEILLRVAHILESEPAAEGASNGVTAEIVNAYRRALAIQPGHREAVTRVTTMLAEEGRHADGAQILEAHLAAISDEYARAECHLDLGRIYAEMLGDSARARAHFEAVLAIQSSHFYAASALRALYKDAREQPLLLGVLKVLLDDCPDLFSRLKVLHEMSEVASEVSREEAFLVNRQIFELDPGAKGVRERLEALAAQLGRYQALADAYAGAAARRSEAAAIELWIAAAQIYDGKLPKPADAIKAYKRALELDPKNVQVHDALERLLRQQDDPAALVEMLRSQLARNTDKEQEPLLYAKIGDLLGREIGDLDGAISTFLKVLEKSPNNAPALASLDDLYRKKEDWERLEAILVQRESSAEDATALAELQARRARVLDEKLKRREEAAELYLDILSRAPEIDVVPALGKLLDDGVLAGRIAKALEPIYAQRGHYERQLLALGILVKEEGDAKKRKELARRAAQIAEGRLDDLGVAFGFVAIGLEIDPASEELRDALLRLAVETKAAERASTVLSSVLEKPGLSPEVTSQIASALAELMELHLSNPRGAIEWYQKALLADGSNAGAIAALERLLGKEQRYEELARLLVERMARAEDKKAKAQLGLGLAAIREKHLNDLSGAIDAYREVLAVEPKEQTALGKLAEVLERQGRYHELVGVLDRMRDASSDPEIQAATEAKAGDALRGQLNAPKDALPRYQRALQLRPGNEQAVRGLEALLDDVELRPKAGALLEPVYAEQNRHRDLVIALESQLAGLVDAERRKTLFFRIAGVEEKDLDQPNGAYETLARAFREGLIGDDGRDALAHLAMRANRARDLAQIYEDAFEQKQKDAGLCRELARLYDGAAASPGKAKAAWERLLALQPGDGEALEAMEKLTAAGDNPAALAGVLMRRAEAAGEKSDRVAFYKRAAAIYEEAAEDLAKATEAMELARAADPSDRSVHQELARFYEQGNDLDKLALAIAAEAELIEEPLQRASAQVRLAQTLERLARLTEAISAYEVALKVLPEHGPAREGIEGLLASVVGPEAALALEPVYRAAGDWAHLVDAYEILAAASKDPQERVERLVAIRSIYEERLGKLDRAFQAAARAYREAPQEKDLVDALERLGRMAGAVEELVGIFEDQADAFPAGSPERRALRARIADYAETVLRDRQRAVDAWKKAVEEAPDDGVALSALERIYTKGGEARELVEVLRQMINLTQDRGERIARLRQAARVLEEKLGDRGGAARAYEQILKLEAKEQDALDRLDVIYTENRSYQDLGRILLEQIGAHEGPKRAQFLLRLGMLRRNALEDPRGALAAFAAVLESGPSDGSYDGALHAVEELIESEKAAMPDLVAEAATIAEEHWIRRGEPLKVVAAKEARIAAADDPAARKSLLMEIAGLYEKQLEQPDMAFLALTRAYGEFPTDANLASALERLATIADHEEELAELYAQALPSIEDGELALRLARRTAHIYDTVLERGENAIPYYNRILSMVADDASALTALERIHRRAGNAGELVQVYRGMLRLAEGDGGQQKLLWGQIAELMEGDLEDTDGAFEAFHNMITLDPKDVGTLRKMAALCESSGRVDHLAQVLVKEAELARRPDEKAQVYLRLGTLFRDRMSDLYSAVTAFAEALKARKDDPGAIAGLAQIAKEGSEGRAEAAAALAPVYAESGAYSEYISCLEIQAQLNKEPLQRKALFAQIAAVYEEKLGRPEHAFTYGCRAAKEDLADEAARARIERLARENDLMEDLAAFYLDEVDEVEDHALQVALRRRVAEIYDHTLKDVDRAISEYKRILEVSPGDPDSLKALERLYRSAGSPAEQAEVYRRLIAQTEDKDGRMRLMRSFARLQAEELKDLPGAIATFRRLLEIEPNDLDALKRLAKLCAAQGRASELADVLERLISAAEADSETQIDAKVELAKVKASRLGDLGGADALFREALRVMPAHADAREFLQERFENSVAEGHVATAQATGEMLSEAMRAASEWNELIQVLTMRVTLADTSLDRVPLNREIAVIYRDRLKQPELAFAKMSAVFVDAPGLSEVREELEALAKALSMFEDLVDVLEQGLVGARDPEAALAIERRVAQLLEKDVGERERAVVAWTRVIARRPMDEEALASLDRLNQALGRWAALAEVLEKRTELAHELGPKLEIILRLGAIWDERLSEKLEAIAWYKKARVIAPENKEALSALSLLLDPASDASELEEVLGELAIKTSESKSLLRLLVRRAELLAGPLSRQPEAIDVYIRVMEIDPGNAGAAKALDPLYEQQDRFGELAELLEQQLSGARDDKEITRLQRRLGLVRGRLGSVDDAVKSFSEILKRNPNDVDALAALRRTYREAGRWEDLVSTLKKLIPLQSNADGVKSIRFELAEIYLSHLKQREEAIESAKRVLDVEPHSPADLMRLEELFVATGAFGEAVKVMSQRAEQSETLGGKVEILFEIAQVYEQKIHRRAGAAAAYEKILSLEKGSRKAYDALAAIYEANGDYKKLVELHNRALDVTEEAEQRKKLLFAIIDIQERWLGSPEAAFTAACRAFAEEGADQRAQDIAERLAEETDNWEILASVYEEQVEDVGVNRALELRRRLGEMYLDKLDDPQQAEHQLELVLSMRPEDEQARGLLNGILEKGGRWRDLIGQLNDQVELVQTTAEKMVLFRRISKIEEERLKDVEGAISSLKRVLDLEPENVEALSELTRIFRAAEKWHPLLNVLQRRLELSYDQEDKKRLRQEIAGVWEDGIGDTGHAIEAYNDVLSLDEDYLPALKALEQLYTQEERWSELVENYERQVTLADNAGEAIIMLTRVASIWEEQFRDLGGASKTLIRILEVDPDHLPTVKSLERVWSQSGDWTNLVDAYTRHIELCDDPTDAVPLHLALGELYLHKLGNEQQAEESFRAALSANPNSKEALRALADLHERQGSWFNALEMLAGLAALLGAQPEAVEIHERIGRINAKELNDARAAKEAFSRALEIAPNANAATRALREMHAADEDWGEVIALFAQEADFTEDGTEQAELYAKAAEAALDHFEDNEQAIRLFEKGLAADAKHVTTLRSLGDLYFAEENWKRAEDVQEKLVERLDRNTDTEELCRAYYRLAYIAEKLGEDHTALKRYLESYELDATYLPTLEGLAAALLRAERWEDAQRVFQTILIQHKASLTDAEVVDLHFQIGDLSMKLDQLDRAKKSFQKALALEPEHAATLRASALLAERLEDWDEAYDFRERLVRLLEGDERFKELVLQAKLCQEKMNEPYRAIDAYVEAKRVRPQDPGVLHALVTLYGQTSQMPRVIDVLSELAHVLSDPVERRKVYMKLAGVYFDHQKNVEKASEALNMALDLDPSYLEAFQLLESILADQQNWPALEANYHRMIKRLPKEAKKHKMVLWRSLGDLYTQVLKHEENARVAYEVVLKLEPEAYDVALLLARLYAAKRELKPKAVSTYHELLQRLPLKSRAEPVRKLFELYFELGQLDRAFCALSALVLMGQATDDENKAYKSLLTKKAPPNPARALNDEMWRSFVLHPRCRTSLRDILSVLYRGAPHLFEASRVPLELKKKKEQVDLSTGSRDARAKLRYYSVWQQLAAAMHVGEMDHYLRAGTADPPRLFPGDPPVLFAGDQHEAFRAMPPRLLIWTLSRQMATARPELAPVRALAPQEVGAAIEAAIQLHSPPGSGIDLNLDRRLIKQWKDVLERTLQERALKALREPVVACLQGREMRHLTKFLEACEHTLSRAAMLFAIDVSAAERGLHEADLLVADMSFSDRKDALVLYMLSDEYFQLREKLGLAIPQA